MKIINLDENCVSRDEIEQRISDISNVIESLLQELKNLYTQLDE